MSGAYVLPVEGAETTSTNAPRELDDPKVTGDVRNQVIGTKRYNPEKWLQSLSAVEGRPMPVIPVAVTMLGSAVILAVWVFVGKAKKGEVLVDSSMHTFIGLAAFFLLSFRANASYDRWYEGRKQWGMVINRTRDRAASPAHAAAPTLPSAARAPQGGAGEPVWRHRQGANGGYVWSEQTKAMWTDHQGTPHEWSVHMEKNGEGGIGDPTPHGVPVQGPGQGPQRRPTLQAGGPQRS